jgi:hypothetical protein
MKQNTYFATMIALATTAFGLLAAGAWNTAIADLLKIVLPGGKGVVSEIIYAIIVTILAITVISNLAKVADKDASKL